MAESADAQPAMTSIQARIAALNLNQVGKNPTSAPLPRKKGPPPPLPTRPPRPSSTAVATGITNVEVASGGPAIEEEAPVLPRRPGAVNGYGNGINNGYSSGNTTPSLPKRPSQNRSTTPSLPARPQNGYPSPPLPSRPLRYEDGGLLSPAISITSSRDGEDRPRLPARRETPKLPLRRPSSTAEEGRYSHTRRGSIESVTSTVSNISSASRRRVLAPEYDPDSLPPLPVRRINSRPSGEEEHRPTLPLRSPSVPALSKPKLNGVTAGNKIPALPSRPQLPTRPTALSDTGSPPPVPLASRPDLSSHKPQPASCLICRDFSAADAHAKRFPREAIPHLDVGWLSRELCAPFDNQTDKARVIFTWLHFNIDYNVKDFLNNNVKGSTPGSTLETGLAVCEGYAALFNALALAAGVESIVVGGHGKGYGYNSSTQIPPPNPTGHAWNAFRLDTGAWKLIDCCWGAGHLDTATNSYKAAFAPERFTQSNEDFGIDHFSENPRYLFREDGRTLSWREYILLDAGRPDTCTSWDGEGWQKRSLTPATKEVHVSQSRDLVRFSFTKICPHWNNITDGKGKHYMPALEVKGPDGQKKPVMPLQNDGYTWWIDVPRNELGMPGDDIKLLYLWKIGDDEARGLTPAGWKDFMSTNTSKTWWFSSLATWKVV